MSLRLMRRFHLPDPRVAAKVLLCSLTLGLATSPSSSCRGEDGTRRAVLESIEKAKKFLVASQRPDGSWQFAPPRQPDSVVMTTFVVRALLSAGLTLNDEPIERGLRWIRDRGDSPEMTHEVALMIEALAAAKDGRRDLAQMRTLVRKLEVGGTRGANDGSWSFGHDPAGFDGDRSKAHFAALSLHEAQRVGLPVSLETWRRAREHWIKRQNTDGGWGEGGSSGGMTAAGIAYLLTAEAMLRAERTELNADGRPDCCGEPLHDAAVEQACRWLGNHFTVRHNPFAGRDGGDLAAAQFYYLYCLERVGRLSGRRFFVSDRGVRRDWYREGAEHLVARQDKLTGSWVGAPAFLEDDPVFATSYALLFLAKGLAPVAINKLEYGSRESPAQDTAAEDWNRHPGDARNLTRFISSLDRWPKAVTWQSVDLAKAKVADLLQAPVLYLHGTEAPRFKPEEVALLEDYLRQGGILFAVRGCGSSAFEEGFRDLVSRMYPSTPIPLRKLDRFHPVFRSQFPLMTPENQEPACDLWGVDVGCRTGIFYSPADIACLWDKWTPLVLPERTSETQAMMERALKIGANVIAYATGRELADKLQREESFFSDASPDGIERDLLQIAKIRHGGDWNAAPQALRNLLMATDRTAGLAASPRQKNVSLADSALFNYPLAYMHGRNAFELDEAARTGLQKYLAQGGVLFADACCASEAFDASFRQMTRRLFPREHLKRIPVDHELFTKRIGFDLSKVRYNPTTDAAAGNQPLPRTDDPFLEGIEVDGRFIVIYSRLDLSCALDRQMPVACDGYVPEDALKLGLNIILYSLLQ